ncbi:MAG: hypothetical protein WC499_00570 [Patescibacteria group bacterium]
MFNLLVAAMLIAAPKTYTVQGGPGLSCDGFIFRGSVDYGKVGLQISESIYYNIEKSYNFLHRAEFRTLLTGTDCDYFFVGGAINETKGKIPTTGVGISAGVGGRFTSWFIIEVGLIWEVFGEFGGTYKYVCDRNSFDNSSSNKSKYGCIFNVTVPLIR